MALRALHIYTVHFKIKEPYPSTRINYSTLNVVANTKELAEGLCREIKGKIVITDTNYLCSAAQETI